MRGLQVLLAPEDYIRAVKAKVVGITKGEVTIIDFRSGIR
jgi:hypothetical protein